jgi:hypothetical protein
MPTLEQLQTVAETLYYIALSISGPLALIGYLRAKQNERREREYKTYDELDNKLLEFQKLALQHDLELIDLPDVSPALAGDRLRKKQQLVTCTLAFSLFQRAYLMFHGQSDRFKARQWAGWNARLERFVNRDTTRDAWQLARAQFDTDFQRFVDGKIAGQLQAAGVDAAIVHAFTQTGLLVWEYNQDLFTPVQLAAWEQAMQAYRTSRAA